MTTSTQLYANNARSTLLNSIDNVVTTLTVQAGQGAKFPSVSAGQYFLATLEASGSIEIVKVTARSGDVFTVVRGQEGTTAASWSANTLIEMRVTRDTLARFARYQDRITEVSSLDSLVSPLTSDANSYLCHDLDDGGNVILAWRNDNNTWSYSTHRTLTVTGTATVGTNTTTQLTSTDIGTLISSVIAGKYIVQFTNGNLAGQTRLVTSSSSNTVSWTTPVSQSPTSGVTTFKIYRSDVSFYSGGGAFLPLAGGTMLGFIVLHTATPTSALHPVSKQHLETGTAVLSNKTIDSAANTLQISGTTITGKSGTGSTVLFGTSPTITTPTISGGSLTDTTANTQTANNNSTKVATTAYTDAQVASGTAVFTNKTFDTAGVGNILKINGTTVSATTGTGAVVLATSPTLTTASLGNSTATTQTANNNTTRVATTAYTDAQVASGTATFTNKTFDTAGVGNSLLINGTAITAKTGTGSVVLATSPTVVGGSFTALTSLAIRSTGAGAFDLTIRNTEDLTAGRNLTIKVNDAPRTIDLSGTLTLGANFTTGSNATTLTTTGITNITLPTSGTLVTTTGTGATGTWGISITGSAVKWNGSSKTVDTAAPSGGVDGDFWFRY